MCPLFCTIFRFWNYKIRAPTVNIFSPSLYNKYIIKYSIINSRNFDFPIVKVRFFIQYLLKNNFKQTSRYITYSFCLPVLWEDWDIPQHIEFRRIFCNHMVEHFLPQQCYLSMCCRLRGILHILLYQHLKSSIEIWQKESKNLSSWNFQSLDLNHSESMWNNFLEQFRKWGGEGDFLRLVQTG